MSTLATLRHFLLIATLAVMVVPPGGTQAPGAAQVAAARAEGTGLIMGRVVRAGSTTGLEGVVVSIGCIGANQPMRDRVRADSQGRFVFFDVPAGAHSICVYRNGYTSAPIRNLEMTAGQRRTNVIITMTPEDAGPAVISGTVVDEAGEPAVGVRVMLLSRIGLTSRGFWQRGGADTDDRGMFRISAAPGEYLVMVPSTQAGVPVSVISAYDSLRQSGQKTNELQRELNAAGMTTGLAPPSAPGSREVVDVGSSMHRVDAVSRPPRSAGGLWVYPTLFYGATSSPLRAELIDLGPGEERAGVNIQLRPVAAARVSGVLTGPAGPVAYTAVRLVARDAGNLLADLDIAATVSDGGGRFSFETVPIGEYLLKVIKIPRASGTTSTATVLETGAAPVTVFSTTSSPTPPPVPDEPTIWATMPLGVRERAELGDLQVTLRYGARITGRVEFSGATPVPAGDVVQRMNIAIHPDDGRSLAGGMVVTSNAPVGRVDAQRQVRIPGLPAGAYTFNASGLPPGWVVKSITIDGRDAWDAPFELAGADVSTLVVTLSDRPTNMNGQVRDRDGQPAAGARVILFPTDRRRWELTSALGRRVRLFVANPEGAYNAQAMPPGEYFVIAVAGSERTSASWSETENLARLSQSAERVELIEGQQVVRHLTIGVRR